MVTKKLNLIGNYVINLFIVHMPPNKHLIKREFKKYKITMKYYSTSVGDLICKKTVGCRWQSDSNRTTLNELPSYNLQILAPEKYAY